MTEFRATPHFWMFVLLQG